MTKNKNILGISLGTRAIGIALIVNGELTDWSIKSFRDMWSEEKNEVILQTIDKILERYTVGIFAITLRGLALKIPNEMGRHAAVCNLHRDINLLAQQKGIYTETFSLQSLKAFSNTSNKLKMRDKVFELYPSLKVEFEKDNENRNGYYLKLFEAVLAAHVLYMQP